MTSMRCSFLVLFLLCTSAFWQSAGAASDSLKVLGHSFVKIKTLEGKVIYIDPFAVNAFDDSADVVLITHEHSDHNEIARVRQRSTCQVIRAANALVSGVYQTFTIGNITVRAVPAYNSYHPKNSCVGYVVEFNSIKLYHAGDTGEIPEMADLTALHITYALIPMDGIYTMTPEVATQAAAMIQAAHDVPIHTMPPPDTYSNTIVARFTSPNALIVHPGETIALTPVITGVAVEGSTPGQFKLDQNYPNPFNPSTVIRYTVRGGQSRDERKIRLAVYDLLGQEVSVLVEGYQKAGEHQVTFNARDLPSGTYFYRLMSDGIVQSRMMLFLK